jgi:conjugative relaxase-like TrwC/TraI family protein
MLTIHEVTGATDAKRYYGAADYYSQGHETVGHWYGKLAESLGQSGKVTKQSFDRMVDNLHPETGERLTARTKTNRRVGYDFTVSHTKSASILRAFANEEDARALDAARDRAGDGMLVEIEADMQCRERRDGANHDIATGNMAVAAFHHTTSRPVPGHPPDMNDHTHLLVFNATQRADGKILAGQFGPLKRDGEYYSAVYDALYARELEKLGFVIDRRGGKKWEIAGISDAMIAKFKKRTDEIEDEAARQGITDPRRKGELGAKTRSKKNKELSPEQLRMAWDAQLTDGERDALGRVYARQIDGTAEVTPAAAVEFAINHCSEKLSVIPERELKRVALLHGLGHVTPDQIDLELRSPQHGLVAEVIDGQGMLTTEVLQEEERRIAGYAASGCGAVAPVGLAEGLTPTLDDGSALSDEQFGAVTDLLTSPNRVNLVQGPAGAGKSSLLAKYDEGMRLAGQEPIYLATTSQATKVLERDGFEAHTVAHFLLDAKMQAAARGGRVVVDEASILGHKDALRLMEAGGRNNLKFVFVGDPMQHGSVGRGAFMRLLTERGLVDPFRLTTIFRQRDEQFRAVAQSLSEGRTAEGFDALDRLGWVSEMPDCRERYAAMAGDYVQTMRDGARWDDVLVVSPIHADAQRITGEIRSQLREAGLLGGEEREFTRLAAMDASEAERGDAATYRSDGLVIQFHQNCKGGFVRGDRLAVTDPAQVPLTEAGKFGLYRTEKIALAAGDVIRFTGTVKTRDGQHTLKNGAAHKVVGFTEGGNIRLENGWVVDKAAGHFRHGFVETSIGSQGRTVNRVILGMPAEAGKALSMQQLYVSATRARDDMRLYTDDKEAVRHAAQRDSRQLLALDLAPEVTEREQRRRRDVAQRQHASVLEKISAAWKKQRERVTPSLPPTPTHAGRLRAGQQQQQGQQL